MNKEDAALFEKVPEHPGEGAYSADDLAKIFVLISDSAYDDQLKRSLELAAYMYFQHRFMSEKSPNTIRAKRRFGRVAGAAERFLKTLERDGPGPVSSSLYLGTSDSEATELQRIKYMDMVESVRKIASRSRFRSLHPGSSFAGAGHAEKSIRRYFIRMLLQIWQVQQGKGLTEDVGAQIDFIEAASRPILAGKDKFGHGNSSRDNIRKELAQIRAQAKAEDELTEFSLD
jgi:hypothetical protein